MNNHSLSACFGLNLFYKSVTIPRNSLDITWILAVIAKRFPQAIQHHINTMFKFHTACGPQITLYFFAGD